MESIKPKRTLVEETYDRLIDAICSGEFPPGKRLNQDEIAAKLNVSRQPVNSAVSILKTNGLVVDNGRRGVVVTRFDPDLFRSIYEYRREIEPFAVRLAGKSMNEKRRTEADQVLETGHKAVKRGTLRALIRADMQFHEMIYRWSGNQVIETSMKTIWHHIRRSMAEVLRDSNAHRSVWDDHARIVENLMSGQVDEAANIMESHIDDAYQAISEAMKDPEAETT